MALVLSGDFDSDKILPLIKEKFSQIKSGKAPERKIVKEKLTV